MFTNIILIRLFHHIIIALNNRWIFSIIGHLILFSSDVWVRLMKFILIWFFSCAFSMRVACLRIKFKGGASSSHNLIYTFWFDQDRWSIFIFLTLNGWFEEVIFFSKYSHILILAFSWLSTFSMCISFTRSYSLRHLNIMHKTVFIDPFS